MKPKFCWILQSHYGSEMSRKSWKYRVLVLLQIEGQGWARKMLKTFYVQFDKMFNIKSISHFNVFQMTINFHKNIFKSVTCYNLIFNSQNGAFGHLAGRRAVINILKINKILHSPLKNVCWPRDAEDSHDTNLISKQYHVPLGKNCPKSPRFLLFYDNYPLMSDVLVTFMCSSDWVRRTTELTQLPAAPLADNGATKVSLFA